MSNMKMKIVVPVYNAEKWIKDCVESIQIQQYKDFRCIVINDASTDNTGHVLNDLKFDSRFIIKHNSENKGALYNVIHGWNSLDSISEPESILITVDGDDKLYNQQSLNVINQVYKKISECLLTYGNYIDWPSGAPGICEKFPQEVINNRSFRSYPKYITSHLRTFKSKLWHRLLPEDLIDSRTNNYYSVTSDLAIMMPLMEMAGNRHVFIEQILYLYNRNNPISDGYVKLKEQWETDQFVRRLPKKELVKFE